jgi:release factor glutamine methyltransferase
MKIQTWLNQSVELLKSVGIDSARLDCLVLLENELGKTRDWLLAHDDEHLGEAEITNLNNKIAQRKSHIPLAYIIGSKEFYGRSFLVTNDVLIPRPESEAIIKLLKTQFPKLSTPATVLDVGTGSGILAITAQLELPETVVIATDISEAALALAKKNAVALKAPVQFYTANLLNTPQSIKPDIILANLPYVPDNLITSEEITKEPSMALFSGTTGLHHYELFWQQAALLPNKPRVIITESLESQHADLIQRASDAGYKLEKTETLAQLFVLNN